MAISQGPPVILGDKILVFLAPLWDWKLGVIFCEGGPVCIPSQFGRLGEEALSSCINNAFFILSFFFLIVPLPTPEKLVLQPPSLSRKNAAAGNPPPLSLPFLPLSLFLGKKRHPPPSNKRIPLQPKPLLH